MMYAATLAGIAFNAGVHIPHGMAYAIAGQVRDFRLAGYPPDAPLVPHGVSVVVAAPAVVRFTAAADPQRHLDCASALGALTRDVPRRLPIREPASRPVSSPLDAGLRATQRPVRAGLCPADITALVSGSAIQQRLLDNAPVSSSAST